jgi:hypothetical protein
LVETLCLTIQLRVVGRAATELDFSKFEQLSPKTAGEDAVSIRDNGSRKPMKTIDGIQEGASNTSSGERMS